jgi:phospholipid/cholesterol/gamma-HCH transport system ATP-binding protein
MSDTRDELDDNAPPIEVRHLRSAFGDHVIHDDLNLTVQRGDVMGVVGGSGAGKSVLLNTIIGLKRPEGGTVRIFGADIQHARRRQWTEIERRWGVLFQQGALWSNLTVRDNVAAPLFEHTDMKSKEIHELADLKIALTGLPVGAGALKPAELSGGMIKRVALARALALDPDIVFLDEPTSGLDPIGAADFDELILTLQRTLGLSVFMVTHDLDSLHAVCGRIAVLSEGRVIADGPIEAMLASEHPWLKSYFRGKRSRPVQH